MSDLAGMVLAWSSSSRLTIRFTNERNCWVSLPGRLVTQLYASQLSTPLLLQLRSAAQAGRAGSGQVWHVAWGGTACEGQHVEISRACAESLGLPEGAAVTLKALTDIPSASSVSVEPANADDWEIISAQAAHIEDNLLNQAGLAKKGNAFPVWVRGQGSVRLQVASCSPADLVRLVRDTEVIIAPCPRPRLDGSRPLIRSDDARAGRHRPHQPPAPICWLRAQRLEPGQAARRLTDARSAGASQASTCVQMQPTGCIFVHPATAAQRCLAAGLPMRLWNAQAKTVGCAILAHSAHVQIGHACASQHLLASFSIAVHSRIGLQPRDTQLPHKEHDRRQPAWTIVLHPLRLHAEHSKACWAQSSLSDQQHGHLGRADQSQSLSSASQRVSMPSKEQLPPDQLMQAWIQHQLKLSTGRQSGSSSADAVFPGADAVDSPAKSSSSVPLVSGSIVAASSIPAQSEASCSALKGHSQEPPSLCMSASNHEANTEMEELYQSFQQVAYEVELIRGRQRAVPAQGQPADLATQQAAMGDQGAASSFRPTPSGQEVPSVMEAISAGPKLEAFVEDGHIQSGQVEVKLGSPRGHQSMSSTSLQPDCASDHATTASDLVSRPGPAADIAEQALSWLLPLLVHGSRCKLASAGAPVPGGLLLCGPRGSGKTSILRGIAAVLGQTPACLAACTWLDCRKVAGEGLPALQRHLLSKVERATASMPAMLVLDDLAILCPSSTQDSPGAAQDTSSGTLVSWLCDLLDSLHLPGQLPLPVVVCGTCADASDLAPALKMAGRLDHVVTLPAPDSNERTHLLQAAFQDCLASASFKMLQEAGSKAEGYTAADLSILRDRAVHAALSRLIAKGQLPRAGMIEVGRGDLEKAQQGFSPAASWGAGQVSAGPEGPQGWQDVGGLADVQASMQETLELPAKYPKLIAKAPLRLRTGLLLYGPPGCGKTHLVAAAVAACDMRCIGVKGPEVLNKYIGASEAAVRDLFRRASAAAPCVLFFDEFDAIAPQRGHDSTGVTDRVVNQLLTELDGVEGLTGVFVIGATSRPDLLDAALLRPGRLDRLLMCPFPSAQERAAIMTALARKVAFADSVDLGAIGRTAEGFTGADLSSLLSEAQLSAVHEALDCSDDAGDIKGTPRISQRHLEQALQNTRPSVSPAERAALQRRFAEFQQGRQPGGLSKITKGKGKKTTLA
ncbi:hypothetical protein WJX74_010633 [Apatococcus lobatus]|uniref:Peroxisomal ATPase PEX1 n=1 Tax=Apatococcus lobatus TaxID=904363 RepID=A0AAW1R3P6_9CHLO